MSPKRAHMERAGRWQAAYKYVLCEVGKIRRSLSEDDKLESRATKLKSAAPIARVWRAPIVSGIDYVNKNKYR